MTDVFTDSSQNIYRKSTLADMRHDLRLADHADLRGFQENTNAKARKAIGELDGRDYRVEHLDYPVPIAFRPDVFKPVSAGVLKAHDGLSSHAANPARYISWVGLKHRETGAQIKRFNVHAAQGYAKSEDGRPPAIVDEWRDNAARIYWLTLLHLTSSAMRSSMWDTVIVGGDFNARMNNDAEWYYPGPLLSSVYDLAHASAGLDHILRAHGSRGTVRQIVKRTKDVRSDHPIVFARYAL